MKGKIIWSFWLVALLAVITSTASYAWLAMNTTAQARGFKVELICDSVYLEISTNADTGFDKEVSFDKVTVKSNAASAHEVLLVSYGTVPEEGALLIYPEQINSKTALLYGPNGKYNGGQVRFYLPSDSERGGGDYNFVDVTDDLAIGQSLVGYYVIEEESEAHVNAQYSDKLYYVKSERENGIIDYCCLGGNFAVGEKLAGRKYWGYSSSTLENESQPTNVMNVVSMDTPTPRYSLKKRVYIRGSKGTVDARNLRITSVEIEGESNPLTDSLRIMFVANSSQGKSATVIYSNRDDAQTFDGKLFEHLLGNETETITVDMYIYYDGKDIDAHNVNTDELTVQIVTVKFGVDDNN